MGAGYDSCGCFFHSAEPPTTIISPLQASRLILGTQLQSLPFAPSIAPTLLMVPLSSISLVVSTVVLNNFDRFVQLDSSHFDGTTEDSSYGFLSECQDQLYNLSILESYGVAYTSYQFIGLIK